MPISELLCLKLSTFFSALSQLSLSFLLAHENSLLIFLDRRSLKYFVLFPSVQVFNLYSPLKYTQIADRPLDQFTQLDLSFRTGVMSNPTGTGYRRLSRTYNFQEWEQPSSLECQVDVPSPDLTASLVVSPSPRDLGLGIGDQGLTITLCTSRQTFMGTITTSKGIL